VLKLTNTAPGSSAGPGLPTLSADLNRPIFGRDGSKSSTQGERHARDDPGRQANLRDIGLTVLAWAQRPRPHPIPSRDLDPGQNKPPWPLDLKESSTDTLAVSAESSGQATLCIPATLRAGRCIPVTDSWRLPIDWQEKRGPVAALSPSALFPDRTDTSCGTLTLDTNGVSPSRFTGNGVLPQGGAPRPQPSHFRPDQPPDPPLQARRKRDGRFSCEPCMIC
jgi:hypothetical protein